MGEAAAVVGEFYATGSTAAATMIVGFVVVSDLRKPRFGASAVRRAHPQTGWEDTRCTCADDPCTYVGLRTLARPGLSPGPGRRSLVELCSDAVDLPLRLGCSGCEYSYSHLLCWSCDWECLCDGCCPRVGEDEAGEGRNRRRPV